MRINPAKVSPMLIDPQSKAFFYLAVPAACSKSVLIPDLGFLGAVASLRITCPPLVTSVSVDMLQKAPGHSNQITKEAT